MTGGSHDTVAARGQTSLNLIQNLNGSNRFKFFQTLTNQKVLFLAQKN
jgi:hypothetical protein